MLSTQSPPTWKANMKQQAENINFRLSSTEGDLNPDLLLLLPGKNLKSPVL